MVRLDKIVDILEPLGWTVVCVKGVIINFLLWTTGILVLCWNIQVEMKFGFEHVKFEMPIQCLNGNVK